MSFQDIEVGRLLNSRRGGYTGMKQQDPTQAIAFGIFQINTSVSTFQRLVNTLGTPKDTHELRDKLHKTRLHIWQLVKDTSEKLKQASETDHRTEVSAEECLKREKDRVSHYLHHSSEPKLLEKVQHELLSTYATQLLEKEHSGCHALLRDDKVDDLARMYRLFAKIPHGLDPVSSIFKKHVATEGIALVKQAEDAASNKKVGDGKEEYTDADIDEMREEWASYVSNFILL